MRPNTLTFGSTGSFKVKIGSREVVVYNTADYCITIIPTDSPITITCGDSPVVVSFNNNGIYHSETIPAGMSRMFWQ